MCFNEQMLGYWSDWLGVDLPRALGKAVLGVATEEACKRLLKREVVKHLSTRAVTAAALGTATGGALAVDGVLDAKKLVQIWRASRKAADKYCSCPESRQRALRR